MKAFSSGGGSAQVGTENPSDRGLPREEGLGGCLRVIWGGTRPLYRETKAPLR